MSTFKSFFDWEIFLKLNNFDDNKNIGNILRHGRYNFFDLKQWLGNLR